MDALAKMATARKHTNVLMHMAGHFKDLLDADEKQELLGEHRGLPPGPRAAHRAR